MTKRYIRLLWVSLFVVATAAACTHHQGYDSDSYTQAPVRLRLSVLDGGELRLRRYLDRFVVLHLFTTWSIAAQQDVDRLKKLAKNPNGPIVIGIALDPDGYRLVSPWRKAMRVSYTIALANKNMQNGDSVLGRIKQVPTTIILDRSGRRWRTFVGPLSDAQIAQIQSFTN